MDSWISTSEADDSDVENQVDVEPDIESLSKTEMLPDETEPAKNAFRMKIAEWKKSELEPLVAESQETVQLNEYLRKTKELYEKLLANPDSEPLSQQMSSVDFKFILDRDLIEAPFTYDTKLINSFSPRDNVFDGNIVPNR